MTVVRPILMLLCVAFGLATLETVTTEQEQQLSRQLQQADPGLEGLTDQLEKLQWHLEALEEVASKGKSGQSAALEDKNLGSTIESLVSQQEAGHKLLQTLSVNEIVRSGELDLLFEEQRSQANALQNVLKLVAAHGDWLNSVSEGLNQGAAVTGQQAAGLGELSEKIENMKSTLGKLETTQVSALQGVIEQAVVSRDQPTKQQIELIDAMQRANIVATVDAVKALEEVDLKSDTLLELVGSLRAVQEQIRDHIGATHSSLVGQEDKLEVLRTMTAISSGRAEADQSELRALLDQLQGVLQSVNSEAAARAEDLSMVTREHIALAHSETTAAVAGLQDQLGLLNQAEQVREQQLQEVQSALQAFQTSSTGEQASAKHLLEGLTSQQAESAVALAAIRTAQQTTAESLKDLSGQASALDATLQQLAGASSAIEEAQRVQGVDLVSLADIGRRALEAATNGGLALDHILTHQRQHEVAWNKKAESLLTHAEVQTTMVSGVDAKLSGVDTKLTVVSDAVNNVTAAVSGARAWAAAVYESATHIFTRLGRGDLSVVFEFSPYWFCSLLGLVLVALRYEAGPWRKRWVVAPLVLCFAIDSQLTVEESRLGLLPRRLFRVFVGLGLLALVLALFVRSRWYVFFRSGCSREVWNASTRVCFMFDQPEGTEGETDGRPANPMRTPLRTPLRTQRSTPLATPQQLFRTPSSKIAPRGTRRALTPRGARSRTPSVRRVPRTPQSF